MPRGPLFEHKLRLRSPSTTGTGVSVRANTGTAVGPRRQLNFIEGSGVTVGVADDTVTPEVDITISADFGEVFPLAGHVFLTQQEGVTTTHSSFGKANPTATGSGTTVVTDSSGHYIRYEQATATQTAGWGGSNNDTQRRYAPEGYFIVKTELSGPELRYWIGLVSAAPSSTDTPGSSAIHLAAFRYSEAVPDTNWQAVTSDGSSDTITDTGVAVVTDTRTKLGLVLSSANVEFYINDVLEATHTTNLPGSTTNLGIFARVTHISGIGDSALLIHRAVFACDF